MHIVDGSKEDIKEQEIELPDIKHEWIGYGLIAIGIVIILERILYPLITYEFRSYLQSSIVSLIFIVMGVVLLRNSKKEAEKNTEYDAEDKTILNHDKIVEEGDHIED